MPSRPTDMRGTTATATVSLPPAVVERAPTATRLRGIIVPGFALEILLVVVVLISLIGN